MLEYLTIPTPTAEQITVALAQAIIQHDAPHRPPYFSGDIAQQWIDTFDPDDAAPAVTAQRVIAAFNGQATAPIIAPIVPLTAYLDSPDEDAGIILVISRDTHRYVTEPLTSESLTTDATTPRGFIDHILTTCITHANAALTQQQIPRYAADEDVFGRLMSAASDHDLDVIERAALDASILVRCPICRWNIHESETHLPCGGCGILLSDEDRARYDNHGDCHDCHRDAESGCECEHTARILALRENDADNACEDDAREVTA